MTRRTILLAAAAAPALTVHGRASADPAAIDDRLAEVGTSIRHLVRPLRGQLCAAALQRSDNTAANLLLSAIGGPPAITDFARSIGDELTRLDRWELELNTAIPGDLRDTSTPRALGTGIRKLLTGTVLGQAQRGQLEQWMRGNTTSSMREDLLPGWSSADKTGTGDYGSTNDVGMVYGPAGQRILVSIMARSQSANPDAAALRPLIADVTRSVLAWLS
uniref:serine hydrolase n=1 Tax=Mycobacterium tilburgii TaxID=44467 RepID=UPI0011820C68